MRRTVLAIGACVCLLAPVAAMAQEQTTAESAVVTSPQVMVFSRSMGEDNSINHLLDKWKKAKEAEREGIQKDLREALKKEFQAGIAANEKEIAELEAQLKQLREKLDLRRQKQEEIVDFRVQQLLREAQGLGWGTEPERSGGLSMPRGYSATFESAPLTVIRASTVTVPGEKSAEKPK
jgi:hypothetical protein